MKSLAAALLPCVLATLAVGCERREPRTVTPPPALGATDSAPHEPFEAPGADGWGRVAGLRYREYLLNGARPEQSLPMLMLIHGMGDQPGERWFEIIRPSVPLRVIMPQAPKPYGSGFSWFDYRVGDNQPNALADGIAGEADRLSRALEVLRRERPTQGAPIVAGFSQGGMLSFALALRHPQQIALALPISGTLPAPLWPADRTRAAPNPPIRALHGTADTVVPFEPTAALLAQLQRLDYDASLQSFEGVGHTITPEMQAAIERLLDPSLRGAAPSGTSAPSAP